MMMKKKQIELPMLVTKAGAFDENGVFAVAKIRATSRNALSLIMGDARFESVRELWIDRTYGHPIEPVVEFLAQPILRNVRRLGGVTSRVYAELAGPMPWTDVTLWDIDGLSALLALAPDLDTLGFQSEHLAIEVVRTSAMAKIATLRVVTGNLGAVGPLMTAVAKSKTAKRLASVEVEQTAFGWSFRFTKGPDGWAFRLACEKRQKLDDGRLAFLDKLLADIPATMRASHEIVIPRSLESSRAAIAALVTRSKPASRRRDRRARR